MVSISCGVMLVLGGLAGHAIGTGQMKVEVESVEKNLAVEVSVRRDRVRSARAEGVVQLRRFKRRVINSQAYVDLLRTLYSVQEKIKGIEKSLEEGI